MTEEKKDSDAEKQPKKTEIEKAKLDDDDILSELGLSEDKAELDSDGIIDLDESGDDKAVLDKDGIFEDISEDTVEETVHAAEEEKTGLDDGTEQKERRQAEESAFARLRKGPWRKAAVIAAATLVVFIAGWFTLAAVVFNSEDAEPDGEIKKTAAPDDFVLPEENIEAPEMVSYVPLESFLVQLTERAQEQSFVKVSVYLTIQTTPKVTIDDHMKKMRSAAYDVLSKRSPDDFTTKAGMNQLQKDMQSSINTVFNYTIVKNVTIADIMIL